jgi:hypothetical protein
VAERTYTTGQVARALGLNVRRLEGWAEQGVLSPAKLRGHTPHGDRRQYAWADIMAAAVLAEAQKLLGRHFRPGAMAELVKTVGRMSFGLLGTPTSEGHPAVLVFEVRKDKPHVEVAYRPTIDHLPTAALLINIERLGTRVREALKREG